LRKIRALETTVTIHRAGAQHLFVRFFTKLNLTIVHATYAEPKQSIARFGSAKVTSPKD